MKALRLILISLVLFIAKAEARQQVSLSEVKSSAVGALKMKTGETLIDEQAIDTVFTLKSESNNTLLYECRFIDGKTVLMSGSKACIPVLGYFDAPSDVSVLDPNADIPEGLRGMLREYQEQIELYFANDTIQLYSEAEWQSLQDNKVMSRTTTPGAYDVVTPLITSKWYQYKSNDGKDLDAYNFYAPDHSICSSSGGKCAAGCAAVAMAQIINYWKHPVYFSTMENSFDWCNMVDELRITSPNYINERNAVARLIYDCGMELKTGYCESGCGSEADAEADARNAFISFQYSTSSYTKKENYSNSSWISMVKSSLNAGRPIYYRGNGSSGHAFVCDGYDSKNYFHFNWGWIGWYDSWFALDDLTPENKNYTSEQGAIFDIYPAITQNYCNYTMNLSDYYRDYNAMTAYPVRILPYKNVPSAFQNLESASVSDSASWRTIPSGATSEYVAHNRITLRPGFHAQSGSKFVARIEPCTNSCNNSQSLVVEQNLEEYESEVSNLSREAFEETISTEPLVESRAAKLYQNAPNPTNGQTAVGYYLPESAGSAWLRIINMNGATVKTMDISATGEGTVIVDTNTLSPGIYFYSLMIGGKLIDTKRMIVD